MKYTKLLGIIALASIALSACGGGNKSSNQESKDSNPGDNSLVSSETQNGWSNAEKEIFTKYFYGVEVPYLAVEDSGSLEYDADEGYAYKVGGTCSGAILANYDALFDSSWDKFTTLGTEYLAEDGLYYSYLKEVTTAEGTRNVGITLAGAVEGDYGLEYSADGSGYFYMFIEDPYYYSWPKDYVDYLLFDVLETTDKVPEFKADFYEVDDSYMDFFGLLVIYAYTDDANAETTYANALKAEGYKYTEKDEYGYSYYVSPSKYVEVQIAYDADYEDLDIYIGPGPAFDEDDIGGGDDVDYGDENPLGGSDKLTCETLGKKAGDSSYSDVEYTSTTTGAMYVGFMSGAKGMQFKSKDDCSGLVSVLSGGTIQKVEVDWDPVSQDTVDVDPAKKGLKVDIYASNTPFDVESMYDGSVTLIGSIDYRSGQTSYTFTSSYTYVGIRSTVGAINLTSVTFTWAAPTK